MSTTVTLPEGLGTASIRDPRMVTEAQRRPVTRLQMRLVSSPVGEILERKAETDEADVAAVKAVDDELTRLIGADTDALELLDDLNDALIVALVEDVNGVPLAGDPTQLAGPVYDALKVETAKYVTALMPTFAVNPNPESPTPPSVN